MRIEKRVLVWRECDRRSSQNFSEILRLVYQVINRKQRGTVAFEMFILDALVKFKGLVGDNSGGDIPIIGNMKTGIKAFSYLRCFWTKGRGLKRINVSYLIQSRYS